MSSGAYNKIAKLAIFQVCHNSNQLLTGHVEEGLPGFNLLLAGSSRRFSRMLSMQCDDFPQEEEEETLHHWH